MLYNGCKKHFTKCQVITTLGDAIKNSIIAMNMTDKEQLAKKKKSIYQYF